MLVTIRQRAVRLLRDKRGVSAYFELAVLVVVCIMILSLSISFLQIYARHSLVNTMAHEMARYVEIKGRIDSNTHAEFERLKTVSGFDSATVEFDKSGKLDLEEEFTVTVRVSEKFGIGSIKVVPVEISAVSTGRSEVYWK